MRDDRLEKQRLKQQIEASRFAENNGAVVRVINILAGNWIRMASIQSALPEMDMGDFLESITYLQKAGYIEIMYNSAQQLIEADKADPKKCDVAFTAKGMSLAKYAISDPAVLV
ncbi:hypothetical protein LJC27_01910 [Christensenellaceae bacterium OttesenSCG-928-M15]|nr:hypothetical protein [Christensenellaceae bacterium OttesenSCG-928-M15]